MISRKLTCIVALLAGSASSLAGQDSTVAWKASLADLERRLPGLPAEEGTAIDAWRSDAEALRSSIISFTASHPDSTFPLPEPLPERPSPQWGWGFASWTIEPH